jgi:prepilin-type N-terminal cleavage/methylation domain-containing protein
MNPPKRTSHRAFTLLEVLLSLSITGVVVGLAGRLAVDAVRIRDAIQSRAKSERPIHMALDQFQRDWQNRFRHEIAVTWDTHHRPMIVMHSLCGFADEGIHLPVRPAVVTYRLVQSPVAGEGLQWLRAVEGLSVGDSVRHTRVILKQVQVFDVMLHNRTEWLELEVEPIDPKRISAVRLSIAAGDSVRTKTFLVDTFSERGDDES